eukprot:365992-Chlamydomonas_euryale.AAC.4
MPIWEQAHTNRAHTHRARCMHGSHPDQNPKQRQSAAHAHTPVPPNAHAHTPVLPKAHVHARTAEPANFGNSANQPPRCQCGTPPT